MTLSLNLPGSRSRLTVPPTNVFELLRARYPAPAWAFLEEVRNGTGFGRVTRTADALAMSLYPSRGLHLHGFEVKTARGDWVRELEDPDKAEEIAKFCHFWWLVVGDGSLVKNGELPATWGLLVRHHDKLVVEKEPMFNKEALLPTHRFLGAILRKVCATSTDEARLQRVRDEAHSHGFEAGKEHMLQSTADGRAQRTLDDLRALIDEFEKTSGVTISRWNLNNVARAVAFLADGYNNPINRLERLVRDAKEISRSASAALAELKAVATLPEKETT